MTLTGLHPGITYVITVYPVNTSGLTGKSAVTTTLQVIPLCTDTFTGLDSNAWEILANWSGGYVPGPGDWVCVNGYSPSIRRGERRRPGAAAGRGTLTVGIGGLLVVASNLNDSGNGDYGEDGALWPVAGPYAARRVHDHCVYRSVP